MKSLIFSFMLSTTINANYCSNLYKRVVNLYSLPKSLVKIRKYSKNKSIALKKRKTSLRISLIEDNIESTKVEFEKNLNKYLSDIILLNKAIKSSNFSNSKKDLLTKLIKAIEIYTNTIFKDEVYNSFFELINKKKKNGWNQKKIFSLYARLYSLSLYDTLFIYFKDDFKKLIKELNVTPEELDSLFSMAQIIHYKYDHSKRNIEFQSLDVHLDALKDIVYKYDIKMSNYYNMKNTSSNFDIYIKEKLKGIGYVYSLNSNSFEDIYLREGYDSYIKIWIESIMTNFETTSWLFVDNYITAAINKKITFAHNSNMTSINYLDHDYYAHMHDAAINLKYKINRIEKNHPSISRERIKDYLTEQKKIIAYTIDHMDTPINGLSIEETRLINHFYFFVVFHEKRVVPDYDYFQSQFVNHFDYGKYILTVANDHVIGKDNYLSKYITPDGYKEFGTKMAITLKAYLPILEKEFLK